MNSYNSRDNYLFSSPLFPFGLNSFHNPFHIQEVKYQTNYIVDVYKDYIVYTGYNLSTKTLFSIYLTKL